MARGDALVWLAAAAGCMLLAACTQTSRVDDDLSTASLTQTKKAVAVMRVGAASPSCINVAVLLGVREGDGYRRHQGITVANVRSITEPAVAEIELDPGEYHVLAYRCQNAAGTTKTVDDNAGGPANGALIITTERNTSGRASAQYAATGEPKSCPTTAAQER